VNAIRIDTTIDEAVARAIPALRPLLGRHVELIALDASQPRRPELSVEEFLAARIKVPVGASSVSLDDIENAIAEGALGR
jgi:putative N-acetylmannosamine-6-phosphate epimerase